MASTGYLQYLVETADPGSTMTAHGLETTLGNINPVFAQKLSAAIQQARAEGINAGVSSGYRDPAWGVGGLKDKYNSLHSYGLAVDISGIGWAGSKTAKRWEQIAEANGVYNPYGYKNYKEFNHYQVTPQKDVAFLAAHPEMRQLLQSGGIKNREA